ncbi:Uma2 family endonuclease [Scytonema sp. NUACC26]|uniref:Uma2 family endonuclease n=1 Tax=Scytonema sp. NUACC26 TaxID=3140176 RepID=UPI0034DC0112
MSLTITDLEQLQQEHPDWQMELVDGNIIVMEPSDYESDEISIRFAAKLWNWVDPRRLGRVTGSSAGFILPHLTTNNTTKRNLRAPDVSFVLAHRLKRTQRDFVELVPDLMVEVKSKTAQIDKLEEKIKMFLRLGTVIGILIDPDQLTLTVYQLNQEPKVLQDGEVLLLPELLPGWELAISDLWPPVFE